MSGARAEANARRSAAAKKAAAVAARQRAQRALYGPEGSERGARPVDGDIGRIMARLRARQLQPDRGS